MTVCAACGQVSPDDRDFCSNVKCGAYLRWEEPTESEQPTRVLRQQPDHEPTLELEISEPEVVEREPLRVTLLRPEDPTAHEGRLEVGVEPGGQLRLIGVVFNQSGIVDHYQLRIAGLDPSWWTIAPDTVSLMPFGSADGASEVRAEVIVHPPRTPDAAARVWEIALVAHSRTHDRDLAADHALLRMAPFRQLDCRVRPQTVRGERGGRFDVPVRNLGNDVALVEFEGEDDEGLLRFDFDPPSLKLPPRGEGRAALTVTAPATISDAPRHRQLMITAADGDALVERRVTFVQEPVAPVVRRSYRFAWRAALTALAVVLLLGGALLDWNAEGDNGVCLNGDSGCLSYNHYVALAGYEEPPVPGLDGGLQTLFAAATSIGVLALLLGVMVLLGARTGRFAWFAGLLAVVLAIVMFATIGTGGIGVWFLLFGGAAAIAASLLARR